MEENRQYCKRIADEIEAYDAGRPLGCSYPVLVFLHLIRWIIGFNDIADGHNRTKILGIRNKYGSIEVLVDDIGRNVVVGKDGISHGLRRGNKGTASENYVVAANAGPILKNSILINELTPKKETAAGSYVLIGVAKDQYDTGYIVEFVVNKFTKDYVLDRNSVKQQAKALMDSVNAKGTSEFSGLLNDFYWQLTTEGPTENDPELF